MPHFCFWSLLDDAFAPAYPLTGRAPQRRRNAVTTRLDMRVLTLSFSFKFRVLAAAGLFSCVVPSSGQDLSPDANTKPKAVFRVLDQQVLDLGNRSIFYNRVETPVLKPQPPPALAPVSRPPTAAELEMMRKWNAKADVSLFLSATVYDRRITEVRWWRENGEYVIWTTIDFNFLRGLCQFETSDTRYSFLLGIGNETSADIAAWNAEIDKRGLPASYKHQIPTLPSLLGAASGNSTYKVVSTPKAGNHAAVLKAFDELHRYYDANRDRLVREYEESEAARIAQEKWNKEHPPIPQDTSINFFPIKSVQTGQPMPGGQK